MLHLKIYRVWIVSIDCRICLIYFFSSRKTLLRVQYNKNIFNLYLLTANNESNVMAISVKDSGTFIYINYHRQEYKDSDRLKRTLSNQSSALAKKDVILDVSSCNSFTSPEIGSVVRLLGDFKDTPRYLRLVINPEIKKALESTGVISLPNLVLYETKEQFVEELKKLAADNSK